MPTLKTVSTCALLQLTSLGALAVSLAACSTEAARSPHNLELRTAPLNLAGIDFACYDLLVENGVGDPVVALGDPTTDLLSTTPDTKTICSTQYGNGDGGAITYIAPCDASEPAHTVTLWVDGLYTGTPATPVAVPFQDPCPNGCVLPATCAPNADTPVEFNLTIMRPANQGFFDVAVNFDDIFCSAKVDCEYAPGDPIDLLHHPDTGARDQTVVLGLACTAGPGATNDTVIFRDPIVVTCAGADPIVLDPTLGDGNIYGPVMADPDLTDPVWQYAIYSGTEDLDCGSLPCNKRYWNVAIGFDSTANGCSLTTTTTASSGVAMPGFTTPDASTYPLIEVDVDLTGPTGGLVCSQHPLNGIPTGVRTTYTTLLDPLALCHRYDGASFATGDASKCASLCASPPCAPGRCVSERYEFTLPESLFDQLTCELPPGQPFAGQCSRAGVPVVFFGQEFANANRTGGAVVPGEGTLGLSFGRWFDPGPASRFQVDFDFSYTRGDVLGRYPEDPFVGKTLEEKMAIIKTALEEAFPCFGVEASVSNTVQSLFNPIPNQSATFKLVTNDASSCTQFDIHTLNRVGVVQSSQMGAGLWAGRTDDDCCNQLYEVTVDITPADVRSGGLSFGYGTFLPEYFSNASYNKLFQLGSSIPAAAFQALPPTPTGNEYEALVASEIAQMGDDRLSAFVNDAGSLVIRFSALETEEFMFGEQFYQLPGSYFDVGATVDQYYSHHLIGLVDYAACAGGDDLATLCPDGPGGGTWTYAGTLTIDPVNPPPENYECIETITGELYIHGGGDFDFRALRVVGNDNDGQIQVHGDGDPFDVTLHFPRLEVAWGGLHFANLNTLVAYHPSLTETGDGAYVHLEGIDSAEVSFPALANASIAFDRVQFADAAFGLPALTTAYDISVWHTNLVSFDLGALTTANLIGVYENDALASMNLGALTTADYFSFLDNPMLSTCAIRDVLAGLSAPPTHLTDVTGNLPDCP